MASEESQGIGENGGSTASSPTTAVGESGGTPQSNGQEANPNTRRRIPRPIQYGRDGRPVKVDSSPNEAPVSDTSSDRRTLGFFSFRNQSQAQLEWLIEGLAYKGVTGMTGAFAKTGKTQVTMRMLIAMLTQETFLKWKIHPRATEEKILFLSLEMNRFEMVHMLSQMTDLDLAQHKVLEDQLLVECGLSQNWQTKEGQKDILEFVRSTGATGLVVDALGSVTKGSINEDTTVREVFDFISHLKLELGCWVWLIHHTRKRTNEGKPHPPTIDDFYGSQYVSGRIRSSLALHKANDEGLLLVSTPAVTLAREVEPFYIQRTDELDFKVTDDKQRPAKQGPVNLTIVKRLIEDGEQFPY